MHKKSSFKFWRPSQGKMAEEGAESNPAPPQTDEGGRLKVAKCPICYDFMTDSRTLLPCMHTFCGQCVEQVTRRKHNGHSGISCPLCRKFVKETGIKSCPLTNTLIEIISSSESDVPDTQPPDGDSGTTSCIQCFYASVTSTCLECEVLLCTRCADRHTRLPICKSHTVLPLAEMNQRTRRISTSQVYCSKHAGEPIKMNCVTCNTVICAQCKFDEHDTHQSETLNSTLEKHTQTMKSALDAISKKTVKKKKALHSIEKRCEFLRDNSLIVKTKLQDQKEKVAKDFLQSLEQEYDKLCAEMEECQAPQIKALQMQREEIEFSLACDKSMLTWSRKTTDNTSGVGLLKELQSDFMERIRQAEGDKLELKPQDPELKKLYQFEAAEEIDEGLAEGLLGHIVSKDYPESDHELDTSSEAEFHDNQSNEGTSQASLTELGQAASNVGLTSFRAIDSDLTLLQNNEITFEKVFEIRDNAQRLCYFQTKIWVPCPHIKKIKLFDLDGIYDGSLHLENVVKPRSLHPFSRNEMALTSESGLYVLDSVGKITSKIMSGNIDDVYVEGETMAALQRLDEQMLYLWDINDFSQPKASFPVTLCRYYFNTLSIIQNSLYVCIGLNSILHRYSFEGEVLQQYDIERQRCHQLMGLYYLCSSDIYGNILVICNDQLQVLSTCGTWSTLNLQVANPQDVLIVGSNIYVLHNSQISKYTIQ